LETAGPIAGRVLVRPPLHSITGIALRPIFFVPAQPGLPVAESRDDDLFTDRFDSDLHWYLPDFALAADVDAGFAFAVSQTGQQLSNGQPYNVARLSLTLTKQRPAKAAALSEANPNAVLREIPLQNLTAMLASSYVDESGNPQQRTCSASTIHDNGDGSFSLVFDKSILGASVLDVYQDLCKIGQASVVLKANFPCWSQSPPHPVFSAALTSSALQRTVLMMPRMLAPPNAAAVAFPRAPIPAPHPAPPNWAQVTLPYSENLPLQLKYNAGAYQSRYTITAGNSPSRTILGAGDLSGFGQPQTQYAEFEELGYLPQKYPSLRGAYLGSVNHVIVLIPQRYSIVRASIPASCLALVDSSPSAASKCKFEFDFVIAPEVSPIDLARLAAEIAGHPDLSGFQITFADSLQSTRPSTLVTSFASSVQFATGIALHTFEVTVTVEDTGADTPAVANANLFIQRLCAQSGTDLIGSLNLKLDDGYPDPVVATIDLNFARTAAAVDELLPQIDESAGAIKLTNQSALDLRIQRYALIQGSNVTEFDTPTLISAGGSVSFPLPASSAGSTFAYDAQLALPSPMNAAAVTKFLAIQNTDVQNTQYVVDLITNVDWTKIASLACTVAFPTLPDIQPWQTTLTANLRADTKHIQIPLENAVFTLPATVCITVDAIDPAVAPLTVSLANDFQASPTMVLSQSELVSPPAPPPASS
jgi:hypothetical protein